MHPQNLPLTAFWIFQVLHLNGNPLGQLTDMAFVSAGLLNLQKLYLPNCSLTDVHPGAFSNLVILIELEMSANQLRTLHPGTFNGNIRLRKLWLTSNPLRSVTQSVRPNLGAQTKTCARKAQSRFAPVVLGCVLGRLPLALHT